MASQETVRKPKDVLATELAVTRQLAALNTFLNLNPDFSVQFTEFLCTRGCMKCDVWHPKCHDCALLEKEASH